MRATSVLTEPSVATLAPAPPAEATPTWGGGTALEVTRDDGTDALGLAFLGRHRIAGIDLGRQLTAGGTIVQRRGRRLLMNPHIWLHAD
jgi:hypothetical protein